MDPILRSAWLGIGVEGQGEEEECCLTMALIHLQNWWNLGGVFQLLDTPRCRCAVTMVPPISGGWEAEAMSLRFLSMVFSRKYLGLRALLHLLVRLVFLIYTFFVAS